MTDIIIRKIDDVFLRVECKESSVAYELTDFFTFKAPGFMFNPLYKKGKWDGNIKLYSMYQQKLYVGLLDYVFKFCSQFNYTYSFNDVENPEIDIKPNEIIEFCKGLDAHSDNKPIKFRDYQLYAVFYGLKYFRRVLLSPTASGKSLIIYAISRYIQQISDKKILIIVPTVSLVSQMFGDFDDYSSNVDWFADDNCHQITGGVEKDADKQIYISTWQSIYKQPKKYFDQFGAILGDEAHQFKATSLKGIMEKNTNCPYKLGFTGTLDGKNVHKLLLIGLFGKTKQIITTKDLIDRGDISKLKIKCLRLAYSKQECADVKHLKYPDELKFLQSHGQRTKFITDLALKQKSNTLVLFQHIKHGNKLQQIIEAKAKEGRKVYLVNGSVAKEVREEIRKIVEKEKDAIIIASYGVFSTGVNIKNIHCIIFGSPSKSKIRVLQSIGRGLRLHKSKDALILFDIGDDLTYITPKGKKKPNYTMLHAIERQKIYIKEKLDYEVYNYPLAA